MPARTKTYAHYTNTGLFWFHNALIVTAVGLGWVLPLPLIIVLIILHRVHITLLNGCALSLVQRHTGGLGPREDFIQLSARRLFHVRLSHQQSSFVSLVIVLCPIALALLKQTLQ